MSAQVYSVPGQTEGIRKAFLESTSVKLGNRGTLLQFSKQISKLSFQLSVQLYSHLGQTEGKKRVFSGRCKRGHIVRLPPRALGYHKRWRSLSFCEIILPLLCFLIDPFAKKHCRTWSSMRNLWILSRTSQK